MMTLLQLDAESPRSVDPELAAGICGMDCDLILELLTSHSEQETAWRSARDEAILTGPRTTRPTSATTRCSTRSGPTTGCDERCGSSSNRRLDGIPGSRRTAGRVVAAREIPAGQAAGIRPARFLLSG